MSSLCSFVANQCLLLLSRFKSVDSLFCVSGLGVLGVLAVRSSLLCIHPCSAMASAL